ncbi:hypothetical protein J7355_17540, partial [Endozoicomonas sp. G2_2]|uniref:hypothetical protein n=1 Tax=Endozoicomonas sp. G2_2 TaxID=2821092 RepID=UPI001ADCE24E
HGDLAGLADGATLSEYERGRQRIERLRQRQDRVFTERMLLNPASERVLAHASIHNMPAPPNPNLSGSNTVSISD